MRSILFDLDGTLWDPVDTIVESWHRVMKAHGLPEVKDLKQKLPFTMGMPSDEFGPILLPDLPKEKVEELIKITCAKEVEVVKEKGGQLYDGVRETLETLSKKYDLFIVSNCQSGYIEAFLEYYKDLKPLFKDWECFGNTGKSKGENIRRVIERNQLSPVAFVGDKDSDAQGAQENNLPFIWAAYGFGKDVQGWDKSISCINELQKFIDS